MFSLLFTNYVMIFIGIDLILFFSLAIIILSKLFNCIASFGLMVKEIVRNPEFKEWFKKVSLGVTPLILFSGIDVEILEILSSHLTNLKLFSAPISDLSKRLIFWGGTVN